jgi:hypothetical protein
MKVRKGMLGYAGEASKGNRVFVRLLLLYAFDGAVLPKLL